MKINLFLCLITSFCYWQSAGSIKISWNGKPEVKQVIGIYFCPVFRDNKGDTLIADIDQFSQYVKKIITKNSFDQFVDNFKPDLTNPSYKFIHVRVRMKGWNEDYTFNEFRKLIWD